MYLEVKEQGEEEEEGEGNRSNSMKDKWQIKRKYFFLKGKVLTKKLIHKA